MGAFTQFNMALPTTVAAIRSQVANELGLSSQRKLLKGRVVKAEDALQCCRQTESKAYGEVVSLVNGIFSKVVEASKTGKEALVMAPLLPALGVEEATRIGVSRVFLTRIGSSLPLGAVVLLSGSTLAAMASELYATELAGALGLGIGQLLDLKRKNGQMDCYDCLKRKVLSQARPREYQTTTIRRRL